MELFDEKSDLNIARKKSILLNARYFDGDFKNSFNELKTLAPLESLGSLDHSKINERLLGSIAMNIYRMEGEALSSIKYDVVKKRFLKFEYPRALLFLGEFTQQLAEKSAVDFFSIEVRANLGLLTFEEVDNFLSKLYDKAHIERMQVSYARSKIAPLNRKVIEKLVTVNPYTRGLKNLMLAFIESDIALASELYKQALNQLSHIKYYYVEALYCYAKFLQSNNQIIK